jgi:glutamate carboxypeptidase
MKSAFKSQERGFNSGVISRIRSPIPPAILGLPARADELQALLTAWANINSGSDSAFGLERMLAALRAEFSKLPDTLVEEFPLSDNPARALRVRARPTEGVQVLLSGHYDTVYGADHPFQHCTLLDSETLRGPGVCDMKGGLVVMLAALQAFEQTPAAPRIGWEIILGPDEETGSTGTSPLLSAVAKRHAFGLVFEPARANGDLVKSRKGTGIFKAICHGRAAHAGRNPGEGCNAILALAEFLPLADRLNEELPGVMLNVGSIRGGGAVNIVPDLAQAEINIRITRRSDEALVINRLREIAAAINARPGYRLEIFGKFNRPPKESTPAEERIFEAWHSCGAELGASFSWMHVGGGSDGNLLSAAGLPNLDGLGPVGDRMHSPEEFVRLPTLVERAQIAALFLHRLASGEFDLVQGYAST